MVGRWTNEPETYFPFEAAGIGSVSPINILLRENHAAGFEMSTNNDVRTTWCRQFRAGLKPGWTAHVVLQPDKRFALRFAHKESKTWSADAPFSADFVSSAVGFEFRLMDNMPSKSLLPLMRLFVLVAAASNSNSSKTCMRASDNLAWASAAAGVLVMGRFAPVSGEYMAKLREQLGLKATKLRRDALDARGALLTICDELHARFNDHPWISLLLKRKYANAPVPDDTNLAGWSDAFSANNRLSQVVLHELKSAAEQGDLASIAAMLPNGWRHDVPYIHAYFTQKNVRVV
jgi:hypothetical protein